MSQETVVYSINLIIGAILATLMMQHLRRSGGDASLQAWTLAALTMTAADALFALRGGLPYWVGRFFPTLLVTVGHGVLLIAAERTAGTLQRHRNVVIVVGVHAAALAFFLATGSASSWRTAVNGLVWGGLSLVAGALLWRAPLAISGAFRFPAFVFLFQGGFHAVRSSLAAIVALGGESPRGTTALQLLGDVEVSFFMVALFASVLVAYLRRTNDELRTALSDVQALSSLLPLCAWCRKVRSDDGYWEQLEQFLSARRIRFTHGICEDCSSKLGSVVSPTGTLPR